MSSKANNLPMSESEQRMVLEGIARDESLYPRDRIAAVKALQDMAKRAGEDLDRELDDILTKK